MRFSAHALLGNHKWPWLIIGLTVLIYAWSLSNGFIWDDYDYLVNNPSLGSLKGLLGYWNVSDSFSAISLTVSALWLEHALWGLSPWGYHVVNLVLHILNALLLFGLVRRLAPSLAGATALLFAIHPIQVETVAWIAEQKNLWCFFFLILAVHSFLDFDLSSKTKYYVRACVFFAAALFSKSIAVCFATIPILYAWWQRGSVSRRDLCLTVPLLVMGVFSILIPLSNESMGSSSDLLAWGLPEKVILAGKNFFFYIRQIVFPWRFLTLYPKWDPRVFFWGDWLFPAGVVAFFVLFYRFRERLGRGAFALLCFYGASILPALGFFKVSLFSITHAADHFSYLSVPPVLLMCCALGRVLLSWIPTTSFREAVTLKRCLFVACVLFLAFSSFRLSLDYKNDVTLFGQLQRECPDSFFANSRLGIVCLDNPGLCSTDRAIESLERAVRIGPDESLTLAKLAVAYERKGLLEQAKQAYGRASIGQDPYSQAHYLDEIGRICIGQRKIPEAILFLTKSLSLKEHPEYLKYRARHFRFQGPGDIAKEKSAGYYLLGQAYFLSRDFKKAGQAFQRVISMAPDWSKGYEGLGASFVNQGDFGQALEAFCKASRLDPQNQSVKSNMEYARSEISKKSIKTSDPW